MKAFFHPLLGTVALASLLLTFTRPALSQEERWEPIGPRGGDMSALTVAPSNPRILYAGTRDGKVYRSADAGLSWRDVTGDFPAGRPVDDLEVDPRNPAKAYAVVCDPEYFDKPAVGGLFKTVDGGRTWALLDRLGCQVLDLAIDPRNPAKLIAGMASGLYRSTDGGASWRAQAGRIPWGEVTAVTFDPQTPGTVYAVDRAAGFARSTNGGATWTVRNAGLPEQLPPLTGLTVSTGGPRTLFLHALTYDTPLYRSLDGGMTWSPAARGLGRRTVNDMAAGASPSRFYAATQDGLFVSNNRGTTWKAAATPLRAPRVLAVPAGSAVVHAADSQGLLKSRDHGATWKETNRGLPPLWTYHVMIAPSDEQVLYANLGMHSLDGGVTWSRDGHAASVLAIDPEDPLAALGAGRGGVWRSTDASVTWQRLTPAGECLAIAAMKIDPQIPANVYAFGTPLHSGCSPIPACPSSLRSTDGGETWSCMADLPANITVLLIARSQPSTLYAFGGYPDLRFFKSVDGGLSWQTVSHHDVGSAVVALSVSPEDPNTLYATIDNVPVRSTDGAVTWSPLSGLPAGQGFSLVIASSDASVLYAFANGNYENFLYRSTDAGASWTALSLDGLPEGFPGLFYTLQISPTDPGTLIAATPSGIFRFRGE